MGTNKRSGPRQSRAGAAIKAPEAKLPIGNGQNPNVTARPSRRDARRAARVERQATKSGEHFGTGDRLSDAHVFEPAPSAAFDAAQRDATERRATLAEIARSQAALERQAASTREETGNAETAAAHAAEQATALATHAQQARTRAIEEAETRRAAEHLDARARAQAYTRSAEGAEARRHADHEAAVQAAADRRAGGERDAQLRVDDARDALALAEGELAVAEFAINTVAAETAANEAQDVADATARSAANAVDADARTAAELERFRLRAVAFEAAEAEIANQRDERDESLAAEAAGLRTLAEARAEQLRDQLDEAERFLDETRAHRADLEAQLHRAEVDAEAIRAADAHAGEVRRAQEQAALDADEVVTALAKTKSEPTA